MTVADLHTGAAQLTDALVQRVQDHLDAGASHVCIQPLDTNAPTRPSLELLEALAPRLCANL